MLDFFQVLGTLYYFLHLFFLKHLFCIFTFFRGLLLRYWKLMQQITHIFKRMRVRVHRKRAIQNLFRLKNRTRIKTRLIVRFWWFLIRSNNTTINLYLTLTYLNIIISFQTILFYPYLLIRNLLITILFLHFIFAFLLCYLCFISDSFWLFSFWGLFCSLWLFWLYLWLFAFEFGTDCLPPC